MKRCNQWRQATMKDRGTAREYMFSDREEHFCSVFNGCKQSRYGRKGHVLTASPFSDQKYR